MRTAAKYTLIAGPLVLLIGIILSRSVADPTPSPTATVTPTPTSTPWVYWGKNPDALSITLSTDKSKYKLGDDVLVKIQETNTSNDAIQFFRPGAVFDYDLYISHGTSVMKPLPGGLRNGCSRFELRGVILTPQATNIECGTRGDYTPISGWGLKITEPGTYYLTAISVAIEQTHDPKQLSNTVEMSNIVEITVTR